MRKELCEVVSNLCIADSIYELTLSGAMVNEMNEPGQFVHVKVSNGLDPMLRRPISIASINKDEGKFTIIYRKQGRGTSILAEKKQGEMVDILGPLGNGFPVEEAAPRETAILVGGGIGVPPLYELAKQLVNKGVQVINILGFQNESAVFYESKFAKLGETYIATVDGAYGTKGFVTDVITEKSINGDILYSCGPTPMLRALETAGYAPKVYLSLEERMGCGIGACFACVCHVKDDPSGYAYKKVCSDGPVFRAGEVAI
ncbi:dihydroorotate oxidase B, electron transfer subunit [Mesobacillus persicus]|uniref:Dihydroorotate dehydrogenase B (NAD(+)), electron transfer subunit n=1 Tax=Mesobacillus persicus TaxID=930146 RepID=A0A1H7YJR5_9BACI|nr:dihydroorotate dehydrogenase electron transfer subunit [Mesobacillus persicus]SEM46181.1 dihydroorotate oxidase B, electron transfer subunit [Mesobacillus persicus]